MVLYRRNRIEGGTYFFTVTLSDRRSRLLVEHASQLREAFRSARRERPFEIDAIAILPDHLHTIMTLPADDSDFAGRWRRIKGHFSSALLDAGVDLPRRSNGELALWQRRYWEHTVRDENDYARHVDYIHFNPVKHGHVRQVSDWPYSSFHRYVRAGLLPDDWAGVVSDGAGSFGERADMHQAISM
ncbi:transposase [Bradyrhizobium guangdongense]|uniref:REP-associated tyrosine transposase n=1 Tax=Bradyrhizobium guangdongense TaxID=1325090 RepID=UPI00112A6891|nr:transposase [Bradyrhizobium guangdongense]TPQ29774.1 transposase [Bradyrhizobium guangdongense]